MHRLFFQPRVITDTCADGTEVTVIDHSLPSASDDRDFVQVYADRYGIRPEDVAAHIANRRRRTEAAEAEATEAKSENAADTTTDTPATETPSPHGQWELLWDELGKKEEVDDTEIVFGGALRLFRSPFITNNTPLTFPAQSLEQISSSIQAGRSPFSGLAPLQIYVGRPSEINDSFLTHAPDAAILAGLSTAVIHFAPKIIPFLVEVGEAFVANLILDAL